MYKEKEHGSPESNSHVAFIMVGMDVGQVASSRLMNSEYSFAGRAGKPVCLMKT